MSKACPICGQLIASLHKINAGTETFIATVSEGVVHYTETAEQFDNGHYYCPLCDADLYTTEQEVITFFTT